MKAFTAAAFAILVAPPALSADPAPDHFIKDAIEGNLAEVQVGDLAQKKGVSQDVKEFGATLAHDHAAANAKAKQAAQSIGVALPTEPGVKQKMMYHELSAFSGEQFDRHFVASMVKDHKDDIAKYQKEVQNGSGPAADYAKQILPDLQKHLQIAEGLEARQKTAKASDVSRE
jgi:putative membrane protein